MPRISPHARRALVEERKGQILAAAAKVFARKGFERATIAAIAKEAGVAEGSIYNYFKNKADLLVSIPRQIIVPAVQSSVGAASLAHLPPEQMLTLVAQNMIGVVQQNVDIIRVVLSSLPTMNRAAQAKYLEQVPLYAVGMLEAYVRAQVSAGVFRADVNPALAARMFPGLLVLTILMQDVLQVPGVPRFDNDALIADAVRLFLHGALTPTRPLPQPSPVRKVRAQGRGVRQTRKRR